MRARGFFKGGSQEEEKGTKAQRGKTKTVFLLLPTACLSGAEKAHSFLLLFNILLLLHDDKRENK
jgi:hypothetical protein